MQADISMFENLGKGGGSSDLSVFGGELEHTQVFVQNDRWNDSYNRFDEGDQLDWDVDLEEGELSLIQSPKIDAWMDKYSTRDGKGSDADRLLSAFGILMYQFYNNGRGVSDGLQQYGEQLRMALPMRGKGLMNGLEYTDDILEYQEKLQNLATFIEGLGDEGMEELSKQ